MACVACDDKVAIGATCNVMKDGDGDENCMFDEKGLCYECVEGMHATLDGCASCDGAQRCVNNASHLLCSDSSTLVGSLCTPLTEHDALLITNNHALKCSETHFADGDVCGGCTDLCVSCTDTSSCSVCAAGTSLAKDGKCAALENAAVQTHNGAVACDDAFVPDKDRQCVSCSAVFGTECRLCSAHECLACNTDLVLDGGVCRKGDKCQTGDGTVCTSCASGSVHFNATDCVPASDCAVYVDGRCIQCVEPNVLLSDGSCTVSKECTDVGDGVCLRCTWGMFADEDGVCHCLSHNEAHPQRVTRRASRARSTRRSAPRAMPRRGCS